MHARRVFSAIALLFAVTAFGIVGCSGSGSSGSANSGSEGSNTAGSAAAGSSNDVKSSGSAAGSDAAVCDVLTSDTALASTAFSAVIPGMTDLSRIEAQNTLLEQVEQPPSGLEHNWVAWLEYREFAAANIDSDPGAVISKFEEVKGTSDALVSFYTGTCL